MTQTSTHTAHAIARAKRDVASCREHEDVVRIEIYVGQEPVRALGYYPRTDGTPDARLAAGLRVASEVLRLLGAQVGAQPTIEHSHEQPHLPVRGSLVLPATTPLPDSWRVVVEPPDNLSHEEARVWLNVRMLAGQTPALRRRTASSGRLRDRLYDAARGSARDAEILAAELGDEEATALIARARA